MSKQSLPAIGIQALAPLSEQDFSDVLAHLDEKRVSYIFEQRPPIFYASLNWLIPTGIILFITHSYFDGIFKEVGKDHYQWFKTAFSSLYKKAFGDDPEVQLTVVGAGKSKAPSQFSGTLSFIYANDYGDSAKLLFPLDITADDYALSCEEFIKLITAHEKRFTNDSLGEEFEFQSQAKTKLLGGKISVEHTRPAVTILLFWNRHDRCFNVLDPVASSRSGELVSKVIGRV